MCLILLRGLIESPLPVGGSFVVAVSPADRKVNGAEVGGKEACYWTSLSDECLLWVRSNQTFDVLSVHVGELISHIEIGEFDELVLVPALRLVDRVTLIFGLLPDSINPHCIALTLYRFPSSYATHRLQ